MVRGYMKAAAAAHPVGGLWYGGMVPYIPTIILLPYGTIACVIPKAKQAKCTVETKQGPLWDKLGAP